MNEATAALRLPLDTMITSYLPRYEPGLQPMSFQSRTPMMILGNRTSAGCELADICQ